MRHSQLISLFTKEPRMSHPSPSTGIFLLLHTVSSLSKKAREVLINGYDSSHLHFIVNNCVCEYILRYPSAPMRRTTGLFSLMLSEKLFYCIGGILENHKFYFPLALLFLRAW